MDEEYTKEDLDNMTPAELCYIAIELGLIDCDKLAKEIWAECGV